MIKKRYCLIVFLLFFTTTIQIGNADSTEVNHNEFVCNEVNSCNESHLIESVPCIGQETRFYCTISSQTMILNFYNYNFSKYEVLYLMGGGFSLLYHPSRLLIPYSSFGCAFRPSNHEYVALLLDLEFEPFHMDLTESNDKIWDSIWSCIKQNISKDRPILVNLDGLILLATHQGICLPDELWNHVPLKVDHAITIVGFNETNQSICYNDPMYSIFGDETKGSYIWVDINTFKTSFARFTKFSPFFPSSYRIIIYQKPNHISYIKEEIIETMFDRCIKRLKGDYRYYTSDTDFPDSYNLTKEYAYGINASKELQHLFGGTVKNQMDTIKQYRLYYKLGIKNKFFTILEQTSQRAFKKDISYILESTVPDYKNIYRLIAEEKLIISEVLKNFSYISNKYEVCSNLMKLEAENWSKIASYNKELMTRGILFSNSRAILILHQMERIMNDIIQIEEQIISLEETKNF